MCKLLTALIVVGLAGCAPSGNPSASAQPPADQTDAVAAPAETKRQAPPQAAPAEKLPAARSMSRDEIAAYVKSIVAVEMSKQAPAGGTEEEQTSLLEEQANAAAKDAVAAAVAEAEQHSREQATQAAQQTSEEERLVARYILSRVELERVEAIRNRLKEGTIWGLAFQDLQFAAAGLATPLLHDELIAAASRSDENIEIDVWATRAQLMPREKIELAQFTPEERQMILSFLDRAARGEPADDTDPRIRQFIYRLPFMRKLVVAALRASQSDK